MAKQIITQKIFDKMVTLGERIPEVPHEPMYYQEPKDDEAREVNSTLVQIFNDRRLHLAVKAYGKKIPFADSKVQDECYNGYHHLALDPVKRMVLIRQEDQFMADHPNETEKRVYQLFQTNGGIYYVQKRFSRTKKYNEGVLAANDIRQYEFGANLNSATKLTGRQILKSLEQALRQIK